MADNVLARIMEWADMAKPVRVVVLTSSRAAPSATLDRFSDYDVIMVVTDVNPFFENREWLKSFGEVLVAYRDPIHDQHGYGRFSYFTFWPIALMKQIAAESKVPWELDIGYSVLLDKDHLTDQLQAPTRKAHIPAPPTEAEFQTLVEEFFHESTYVAKHLWRGDLMPLKYNLDQAMKQVNLRRVLEWRIEIDHHWSVKPGAYGKGLKKLLKPSIWKELERTYVGSMLEDNWDALFRTISLFRKIAKEVAGFLEFRYPDELDQRVVRYLQQVRTEERP
jgi:aminoglycoside 6-adenylyltransferase